MKKYLTNDIVVPAVIILIAGFWLNTSLAMQVSSNNVVGYSTPTTVPNFVLAVIIVLSIVTLIEEVMKEYKKHEKKENISGKGKDILKVLALSALMVGYALTLRSVGFIPVSIVLTILTMLLFGEKNKIMLIAVPIGITLIIYILFRFGLSVILP